MTGLVLGDGESEVSFFATLISREVSCDITAEISWTKPPGLSIYGTRVKFLFEYLKIITIGTAKNYNQVILKFR